MFVSIIPDCRLKSQGIPRLPAKNLYSENVTRTHPLSSNDSLAKFFTVPLANYQGGQ